MATKKNTLCIRQVKSGIGYSASQRATLRGLGIRRMNQLVEVQDTPAVRGMINKVPHLVRIESGE